MRFVGFYIPIIKNLMPTTVSMKHKNPPPPPPPPGWEAMDRLLTLFAEFNIDNGTGAGVGVDPPWHVDVVLAHIRDCKPWCLRVCGTARSVDCVELNWTVIISGVIATNGLTWRKQSCFLNLGQVQQISNGAHSRGVFPRHLPPPPPLLLSK